MKKRRMKRRVLAAMMTACMAVGAVPGVTFAENGTGSIPADSLTPQVNGYTFEGTKTSPDNADIRLSKTASYDASQDAYNITLTAEADQVITMNPTEVVYLLDASGSMNFCDANIKEKGEKYTSNPDGHEHYELYETNTDPGSGPGHGHGPGHDPDPGSGYGKFIGWRCSKVVRGEAESRWKIATDAIQSMTENLGSDGITYKYAYFSDSAAFSRADKPYDGIDPKGGTYLTTGIDAAIDELNRTSNTNKVLIVVSDGEASDENYSTNKLTSFKKDANNKVFTVGFAFKNDQFDKIANDGCNYNADNAGELKLAFDTIKENVKGLIDDPMGDHVDLLENDTKLPVSGENGHEYADAEVKDKRIVWKDANGLTSQKASITYTVKVKEESKKAGTIDLNGNATLNYSYQGKNYSVAFPTPSVTGAALTVNYVDDATGKTVKTDTDWIGLTGENVSFRNITEIPSEITADGKTYYVISSEPETIPVPTEGVDYKVTVQVSSEQPQQKHTVTYKAEGIPATSVTLPAAAEYLEGEEVTIAEAPNAEGYVFAGWRYEGLERNDVEGGKFKMPAHPVTLVAIYEKAEEPEIPDLPSKDDFPSVVVTCINENRAHEIVAEAYPIDDEFDLSTVKEEDGTFTCDVTVHGWYYAKKFNEDCGLKHPVTVRDTSFTMTWNAEKEAWEAPAATSIEPIKVDCTGREEPQEPDLPSYEELKDLIGNVVLVHTGSNAEHADAEYELFEGSYTIASAGNAKATASNARAIVTVKADLYLDAYEEENGEHAAEGKTSVKLFLAYGEDGWTIEKGETPVTFIVKCSGKTPEEPEIPDLPKYDELKKVFGKAITVTCITNADHAAENFELLAGSYGVTRAKDNENEAIVTVRADAYIKAFSDGTHTNAGNDAARVALRYDQEDGTWYYTSDEELHIDFQAKCEKQEPEKQYGNIRFIVVNGTFTENGKTELTKSFEVGTTLTTADIPASAGLNSHYSDASWDRSPAGYVVDKDGAAFTITYKWKSSGGSSGGGGGSSSGSARKYATDASGKSGRWILEGGEFTESNGRLPSNEYLKIGDTIYGFYTYGFAIDFDRPEYYTDAAIQAKGGYRTATGTWRLNGWWFCYDDGTFPHGEWKYLTWNGRSDWYYFDVDGWMEDGWLRWNNNWYYLHTKYDNTRGHMYTGWHEIDGKWYYFNTASDKGTLGAMLANTTTPDGFKVGPDGAWIR